MRLYEFIRSLSSEHRDWEAVLLFYAPTHKVQEHAVLHGHRKPESHPERLRYVKTHFRDLYEDFLWLFLLSLSARYDPEYVVTAEIRDLAERKCLRIRTALS